MSIRQISIPLAVLVLVHTMQPITRADESPAAQKAIVEAYRGVPFGVGVVSFPVDTHWNPDTERLNLLRDHWLGDTQFYPVAERRGVATTPVFRNSDMVHVYFLFDTERAEQLLVRGNLTPLQPVNDETAHRKLLEQWWRLYNQQAEAHAANNNFPQQIDQYLINMLGRRLNLKPIESGRPTYRYNADLENIAGFLTGTESVRLAMQKDALLQTSQEQHASEPLPAAASPPAIEIPMPAPDADVEEIARHVPLECFYLRFTRYEDLTWFASMVDLWGTELNALMSSRGMQFDAMDRVQQQLNLQQTDLAKHLSPLAVKDYAIIGNDPFVREGAGVGVLFHAAEGDLLKAHLQSERQRCADQHDDVTLADAAIAGTDATVSLLSSPDNRVRSFYVVRGDFHLVTTSSTIVRRFLETDAAPETSLGASQEFRYARTTTPTSRDDNAFIYLSDNFFRKFVDPAFRIEMTRRAASEAEMELVSLALLAARSEQKPHASLAELIDGGFLPPGFDRRADGSRLILENGRVTDSVRGARGTFVPVADVVVDKATKSEVEGYEKFAAVYRRIWTRMDPAVLAIQRHITEKQERLVLDMHVYPYPRQEFGFLDFLQPQKTQEKLAEIPGALIVAQANVLGMEPAIAGMMDFDAPVIINNGKLDHSASNVIDMPWFLGSVGNTAMGVYFGGNEIPWKDEQIVESTSPNRNHSTVGRFGYRSGKFSMISGNRMALEAMQGNLTMVPAERPAELRIRVGDLRMSALSRYFHAAIWTEVERISTGHEELLNHMLSQFHVRGKEVTKVTEKTLAARPVNPFGGEYELSDGNVIRRTMKQSVADYKSPFLNRLRGGEFELTTEGTTLTTHAEITLDLQSP